MSERDTKELVGVPVGVELKDGGNGSGTQLERAMAERPWPPPLPRRFGAFEEDYRTFCEECLAELGGLGEATVKELALVESTAEVRVLRRKCGRNLLARGISKRNGDLRGPVKVYVALVNAERQGLLALGLTRRAKAIPTLRGYLDARQRGQGGEGGAA